MLAKPLPHQPDQNTRNQRQKDHGEKRQRDLVWNTQQGGRIIRDQPQRHKLTVRKRKREQHHGQRDKKQITNDPHIDAPIFRSNDPEAVCRF